MATFNALSETTGQVRVAVVATGVVSPLGFGLEETLNALRKATDCVTPVVGFDVTRCRCKTAAQISDQRLLGRHRNGRKNGRLHRAAHMMITALEQLSGQDSEFKPELSVIGTTSGGMSFGQDYYRALHRHRNLRRSPEWVANYPPQKPVLDAQERGLTDVYARVAHPGARSLFDRLRRGGAGLDQAMAAANGLTAA